jgi:hypothetical protein
MADLQMTVTENEREFLAKLLQTVLNEKRVEEHRTRTPSYRKDIISEEDMISSLLGKLGKAPA